MVCYATPLIGGPRKTFANRCNNNSPRETRRTIMQSLSAIENFLGFQSTREHNASILPKCLDESLGSSLQRYCKARENTNLFAVFRAAAYLHLAEQDKCSESFNTLQQIPHKKRHPRGCPYIYKRVDNASHPQHNVGIYMQFTANLTPYLQGRLTLSREVFAHSRGTDTEQLG